MFGERGNERKKEKRKNRESNNQALRKNLAPLSSGECLKDPFLYATWENYLRMLNVCLRIKCVLKSHDRDLPLNPPSCATASKVIEKYGQKKDFTNECPC